MAEQNKIYNMDCLAGLRTLPDQSVNCCVTSPPYYGLRDYGVAGQLGLEDTPEEYVARMVEVFEEVRRVLKDDGTLWINIGDSYSSSSTGNPTIKSTLQGGLKNQIESGKRPSKLGLPGIKPKDLIGVPWMLAFALRSVGWYLRQDIIWSKSNPMPESVTDRCTKAHEYLFMLSKESKYYYDAASIKTNTEWSADNTKMPDGRDTGPGGHGSFHRNGREKGAIKKPDKQRGHSRRHNGFNDRWDQMTTKEQMSMGANKRSVWVVPTQPFPEAHFATFPEDLIVPCIKAGCPEGGTVIDPFMGAGTTALVARKLNRNYIGFELNPIT